MATGKAIRALVVSSALLQVTTAYAVCDASQTDSTPTSRYEIRGAEVYDSRSDLTWQRCSIGQQWKEDLGCVGVIRQMPWQDAANLATKRWQLPTRDELSTLIAASCRNPAINEDVFPDMELNKLWYWSGSRNDALVWYVAFGGGSVRNGGPLTLNSVRLVRRGR